MSYAGQYRDLIAAQTRDAYEFAKKGAADELHVQAPGTKRDTTTLINQNAQMVTDKQMSDLLFLVKSEVLKRLRKNDLSETIDLSLSDLLGSIGAAFDSFFTDKVGLTGAVALAQAINRGREDVFGANRQDIAVYQYSALMDNLVCPICADLDGTVVDYAGYVASKWKPPIHFNCRCIWVAILSDQTDIPDITGFPQDPGGESGPSL